MERRIERPVVDAERVLGEELDALRDVPPVGRTCLQQLQDDQIERSGEERCLVLRHGTIHAILAGLSGD